MNNEQKPETKYSDAEIGKKLRRLSAEMRNELCGDFADKLDAILASHQATVESLEDALFQISVRLGEVREPDMDDMSWHTQLIARAQYLADHQPTPDKAGVSDADVEAALSEFHDWIGLMDEEREDAQHRVAMRAALAHFASRSAEAVRGGWRDPNTAPVSTPMHQVYFLANCPNDDWSPGGNVHFACYYGDQGQCRPTGTNGSRAFNGWMPIPPAMQEQSHD